MSNLKATIKIKKDHIPFDPNNPIDVEKALKGIDKIELREPRVTKPKKIR